MKIICVGRNYALHVQELKNESPEEPVLFLKPSTALLDNNQSFHYPSFSNDIHHEIELVLKIKKWGKDISIDQANEYFDEVTVGIDFTARDIQTSCKQKGLPWEKAKAFDGAAVVGKFVKKTHKNEFYLTVNKEQKQSGNSNDMIFPCDSLIAYISTYFTLEPGDFIFTGTPAGVGPVKLGDLLEGYLNHEKCFECKIS